MSMLLGTAVLSASTMLATPSLAGLDGVFAATTTTKIVESSSMSEVMDAATAIRSNRIRAIGSRTAVPIDPAT